MPEAESRSAPYVAVMGETLGSEYAALYDDVVWLHTKWIVYRQVFANDTPGRLRMLNEAAGFYFFVTQDVMWRDILLHLARVTDSPRSVGRDNLTLQRLPLSIEDSELREEVESLLAVATAKCASARTWRNKRLAHHDLEHALATADDPLPGVSRAAIEEALLAIREVMNRLQLHFFDGHVAYEQTILGVLDGDALAAVVEFGLKAREQRARDREEMIRRLEAGEALPEDWTWE
jgi:hypothetical protein